MAVTSTRKVIVTYTGDLVGTFSFSAASNATAPGDIDSINLSSGANTVTIPSTAKGATIVPPAGNTQTLTLKGISGDTGIALSKTDPTSISFDTTPPASFILTAGGTINGLRVVWS